MLHRLPIVGLDVVNSQLVQSMFFMRWFFALTFWESMKPSSSLLLTFHRAFNHAFGILLESRFEKIQPLVL